VARIPKRIKMKNKRLASQRRQRTKGGSLPGSLARLTEERHSARIATEVTAPVDRFEKAPGQPGEGRSRAVSILLHRTVLQLFASENGTEESADESSNATWELRRRTELPTPESFGANGNIARNGSADLLADAVRVCFPTWKRMLDLCLVAMTACLWLPLMMLIMCLIKLTSPGPALYRQRRIGFRGRSFLIFKFRTMKVNAETQMHEDYVGELMRSESPLTKLDANDPRLISFGRFLRATGLDELPQIFNVLRGDMSLVGPRPCTDREFERYLPWQRARVNAPPGLTGYWQVNGKNKTTFSQMMRMDLYYARKMSLSLDLTILCKTLPAIVEQTLDSFAMRSASHGDEKLIAVIPGRPYDGHGGQL
jgi:exopolysaccharide production protein ExoY